MPLGHELHALLAGARLPLEGARESLGGFVLAHRDAALIGSACVERYGKNGLLRSVAVAESERGKGLGIAPIEQVLQQAREQQLKSLFLLTETARDFFSRFGFREVARDDVPEAVKASVEFKSVCPISATVMRLDLASQTTIRAATESDLPAILAIYNEAVLTTAASYDYEPRLAEAQAEWFREHQAQDLPVFVATDERGQIAGWSCLSRFRPRPGYRFTAENSIYIAAEQRGKGFAKLLMAPLIDAARAHGFHSIIAVVDANNEASVRLHEQFGFARVGLLREVGYKFDRWLDIALMQLTLS